MISILVTALYLTVPPVKGDYCTVDNPDFDGYRYEESIPHCRRNVTTEEKDAICVRDGVTERTDDYTVDHIIPLSLGGSNSKNNLWCQHISLAVTPLETKMYTQLKDGKINQKEAVGTILKAKFH